jgi:hypothetical protein
MVEDKHREALQKMVPAQPRYLDGSRKSGKLVRRWNLVIPENVLDRRGIHHGGPYPGTPAFGRA